MTATSSQPRQDYVKSFWDHGYAVVRGVFTPDEVEQLRDNVYKSRDHQGDLLSNPLLRSTVLDPRILEITENVLGGTPVYFGDGSVSLGNQSHGYHKDNPDRANQQAPDWKSRYTVMRMGIYLQDHAKHSGGLNVRRDSHTTTSLKFGRNVYLRTRIGDVAIWSLRTSHSGNGRLLRLLRNVHLEPAKADRLPQWMFAPEQRERAALFMSFGLEDHHLERYISYLKTRKYMVDIWRASRYDAAVWEAAEERNVRILDIGSEIEHASDVGMNEKHVPIPF